MIKDVLNAELLNQNRLLMKRNTKSTGLPQVQELKILEYYFQVLKGDLLGAQLKRNQRTLKLMTSFVPLVSRR